MTPKSALSACIVVAASQVAWADPLPASRAQIVGAIHQCEDALAPNATNRGELASLYVRDRDDAIKTDPSIRTWNGTLGIYNVKDELAKCDRQLGAIASRVDAKHAAADPIGAFEDQCGERADATEAVLTACKQREAELVAQLGADKKLKLDQTLNYLGVRVQTATKAQTGNKAFAAFKASLRKDRLSVFNRWNQYPFDGDNAHFQDPVRFASQIRNASVWNFTSYDEATVNNQRGDTVATVDRGSCTVTYTFRGDALASTKKTGNRCR